MDKEKALEICRREKLEIKGEIFEDYDFGWMEDDGDPIKLIMCLINKNDNKCPCKNNKLKFKTKLGKTPRGMYFWNMYNRHVESMKTLKWGCR